MARDGDDDDELLLTDALDASGVVLEVPSATPISHVCHLCNGQHDATGGEKILACQCPSMVHRRCLDKQRATSDAPNSFTRCPRCQFDYHIVVQNTNLDDPGRSSWKRRAKFRML